MPIVIRGVDLLGQPFEERTATFNFNLHGCRYASRYHLPKNAWITLEVPRGSEFENARARVAWIQRPPSVREFFQISVELETPQNIWRFEPAPEDWSAAPAAGSPVERAEAVHSYAPPSSGIEPQSSNISSELKEQSVNEGNSVSSEANVAESASPQLTQSADSGAGFEQTEPAPTQVAEHAEPAGLPEQKPWIPEDLFAKWRQEFEVTQQAARERMATELNAAEKQWNELLESSLDTAVHRISEQLSVRAGELRKPLLESVNDANETAAKLRGVLEEELGRAKTSLADIERAASGFASLSNQIGAATEGALEDFSHRLELILKAQTEEMGERSEGLTSGKIAAATSELDRVTRKAVEAASAEIESKMAPQYQRAAELLEHLSSREMQADESLRLHRERLRQVAENSEREFLARVAAVEAATREDFEAAQKSAAAKWNEGIETGTRLAARAAAESIEKVSEGFEEQWRARLQAIADQALESAARSLAQTAGEAKNEFAADLGARTSERMEHVREQLDGLANELVARSRSQIEQASEQAAAGFGQVVRGVSDQEIDAFNAKASSAAERQQQELEASAARVLGNFETSAESSLARLHHQMDAQLETSIAEARSALAAECNSSFAAFRSEREAHEKEWSETLDRLNTESVGRYQDRIDTACDSWVVSSVRRLNEHGQNLVESLMRSADQAVRESCAKLFEGLAEILRERSMNAMHASYSAGGVHETAEAAAAPAGNESGLDQASL